VRIDVCARNGRFAKPYYVLLRSERGHAAGKESSRRLRVHRHTIPAFISVAKIEGAYLPRARRVGGNEDGNGDASSEEDPAPTKSSRSKSSIRKQDLSGFVRELRRELVAWHMRVDAIDLLREWVGLVDSEGRVTPSEDVSPDPSTGIVGLAAVSIEARYVRVEWEDGRVGRFKLSNGGVVERAVVIGDTGRDKVTEDLMTGGGGRVEGILERLRVKSGVGSPS
jgi:central kinetochore subunit Mal2/MCM21